MPFGLSIEYMFAVAIVIFLAIGFHEFAHCKFADMAGDPTPRLYGRVTLDLTKHFELWGTIMIVITSITGIGIGWGKPAPMNPSKMKNPRWDHFMAVAAGPLSNVLQACVWAVLLRVTAMVSPGVFEQVPFITMLFTMGVLINIALALFNLIPIGVLDGMWLVGLLMNEQARVKWFQFNRQVGFQGFLGLLLLDQIFLRPTGFSIFGTLLFTPTRFITSFLIGTPM